MKLTKMHSLLLAGASLATVPMISTNKTATLQNTAINNPLIAPQDGTIVVHEYPKLYEVQKLSLKSTTYLKNKSAVSLLSKIK